MPAAPTVDDVIAAIRAYARQQQWTRKDIARAAGMHDTTLRDFWEPSWSPTTPTLRILRALLPEGFDPRKVPPPDKLPPRIEEKKATTAGRRFAAHEPKG